jgi:hypothetical protein
MTRQSIARVANQFYSLRLVIAGLVPAIRVIAVDVH